MISVRSAYSGKHPSSTQTVLAGERLRITLTLDASELKGRGWQAGDLATNHFRADLIASVVQVDSGTTPTASLLRRRSSAMIDEPSILLGSRDLPPPRVRCESDGVVIDMELQLDTHPMYYNQNVVLVIYIDSPTDQVTAGMMQLSQHNPRALDDSFEQTVRGFISFNRTTSVADSTYRVDTDLFILQPLQVSFRSNFIQSLNRTLISVLVENRSELNIRLSVDVDPSAALDSHVLADDEITQMVTPGSLNHLAWMPALAVSATPVGIALRELYQSHLMFAAVDVLPHECLQFVLQLDSICPAPASIQSIATCSTPLSLSWAPAETLSMLQLPVRVGWLASHSASL